MGLIKNATGPIRWPLWDSSKLQNVLRDLINLGSLIPSASSLDLDTSYKKEANLLQYFATRALHQHSIQLSTKLIITFPWVWNMGRWLQEYRATWKISQKLSCRSPGKIKCQISQLLGGKKIQQIIKALIIKDQVWCTLQVWGVLQMTWPMLDFLTTEASWVHF